MKPTPLAETFHMAQPVKPVPDFMLTPLPMVWCAMALNMSAWGVALLTNAMRFPMPVPPARQPLSFA